MEEQTTPKVVEKKENLSIPIAIIIAGMIVAGALIYTNQPATGTTVAATGNQKQFTSPTEVPNFAACLESGKYFERVNRDLEEGISIGVRGTPYAIIWNKKTGVQVPVAGAYPLENLRTLLKQAMTGEDPKDHKRVSSEILSIKPDDHVFGNKNADIVIIEYSDLECPFCIRFHATMHQLMLTRKAENDLAWVYRHFPLNIHPRAVKEAEATECIAEQGGDEMFWKYVDRSFSITPGNDQLDPREMYGIAKFVGAK